MLTCTNLWNTKKKMVQIWIFRNKDSAKFSQTSKQLPYKDFRINQKSTWWAVQIMHSGRHKPLPDAHFARILHAGKSAPDPSQGRRSCRFHKVLEPQNLQHPDWVGHPHPADLRHKNGEHACGSWLKMKDRFWWRCWFWFKQQNFNKSAQLGVHSSGQICNPCTSKLKTEMLCHGFGEDHTFIHSDFACKSIPRLAVNPVTSFG